MERRFFILSLFTKEKLSPMCSCWTSYGLDDSHFGNSIHALLYGRHFALSKCVCGICVWYVSMFSLTYTYLWVLFIQRFQIVCFMFVCLYVLCDYTGEHCDAESSTRMLGLPFRQYMFIGRESRQMLYVDIANIVCVLFVYGTQTVVGIHVNYLENVCNSSMVCSYLHQSFNKV